MAESAEAALRGGAGMLAVAAATEAFELRQSQPEVPILTMGALTGAELDVALQARSELTVWSEGFFETLAESASMLGVHAPGPRQVRQRDGAARLRATRQR